MINIFFEMAGHRVVLYGDFEIIEKKLISFYWTGYCYGEIVKVRKFTMYHKNLIMILDIYNFSEMFKECTTLT